MSQQSRRISTSGGFAFSLALVLAAMEYVKDAPSLSPENAVFGGNINNAPCRGVADSVSISRLRWVWRNLLDPNRL